MSLDLYVRMTAPESTARFNNTTVGESIPGSYFLWRVLEHAGYALTGPDGTCGEVAQADEKPKAGILRHRALLLLCEVLLEDGSLSGSLFIENEPQRLHVKAMKQMLEDLLAYAKAAHNLGLNIQYTLAWS